MLNKENIYKKFIPHLAALGIFLFLTAVYLKPVVFEGKRLSQHDVQMWQGMSKEILDWHDKTGHYPLWTNSMFSGMPAYQISMPTKGNLIEHVNNILWLGLPTPANVVFMLFVGFYLLLITLKFDWRLAMAGSFAYAFCTYNFIIIQAGHNSKIHAIALMPFVLAGILMTLRGNLFKGGVLTAIALSLEVFANHVQIAYYLAIGVLVLMISEAIFALKEKRFVQYIKAAVVIIFAAALAILPNTTVLWATYEYGKYSTRGASELSEKKESTGLDKDYALGWSYGIGETMTLLIPNFNGGPSSSELSKKSALYKAMEDNGAGSQALQFIRNAPTYWGDQPSTSGPTYAGAIVIFFFVLGLFIVEGKNKWWLLGATLISIMLAWGRNFEAFSDLFFFYFPGYNMFRTVSMMLTLASLTMPLLAMLAIKKIIDAKDPWVYKKQILNSFYIVGGLCTLFVLVPGIAGNFSSLADENFKKYDWLINALREDRASMLRIDALRSLFFVAVAFGLLWFYLKGKLKQHVFFIALAAAFLVDGWIVNKRYLNDDYFVSQSKAKVPFEPSAADQEILRDTSYYRVMNTAVSTFNDASTSYFHKSIGGYHGAKLKRYQELIEMQISKGNMKMLDMLNMKYVIQQNKEGQVYAVPNPEALGNAWFVNGYRFVPNADSEMSALTGLNPRTTAIIDQRFSEKLKGFKINVDSSASIKLTSYAPDKLSYHSVSNSDQLAVFSDIYYPKGWNATIDGKPAEYVRANYVLRAMKIPSGSHEIIFEFSPTVYNDGERISFAGSALLLILGAVAVFISLRKKKES